MASPTRARLAASLGHHLPPPGARIGLLGGSFNPAHDGHRQITLDALQRLGLDQVWWLVSPQNPLKGTGDMAPLAERLATARRTARHPRVRVSDIETLLGTTYTAKTIKLMCHHFPKVRFVWLMGADNLVQIPAWQDWTRIFNSVAVAVFDRPSYSLRACAGQAARRFARHRLPEGRARRVATRCPPAWVFLHSRLNASSATALRAAQRRGPRPAGGGVPTDGHGPVAQGGA